MARPTPRSCGPTLATPPSARQFPPTEARSTQGRVRSHLIRIPPATPASVIPTRSRQTSATRSVDQESGGSPVLTVTMKVADLSATSVAAASTNVTGAQFLQYVTRWQMGNTIYYAMMEATPVLAAAGKYQFYAGRAQSIDLCSVSACDPHVIVYPEAPSAGANTEAGSVSCPLTSSSRKSARPV